MFDRNARAEKSNSGESVSISAFPGGQRIVEWFKGCDAKLKLALLLTTSCFYYPHHDPLGFVYTTNNIASLTRHI